MTKKLFNVTIDVGLLDKFDKHAKANGYNKSRLCEIWMKDWLKKEGVIKNES